VSVTLVIQHAKRMRCVILSFLSCLAVPYFSTLCHKRHDFRNIFYTKCVVWFSLQLPYETFLILRRMNIGIHVKYPLFLSDFNETWIFWTDFRKLLKYRISWKIHPVRAELFHAGGQKYRHDEADGRFSQIWERA
jgi:hypothetical protein